MAINNPYVPGDPFSYDLKWLVRKIREHQIILDGLDERIQNAIIAALEDLDQLGPKYFESAADLIGSDLKDKSIAYIEGFFAPGDGGANLYYVTTDYNDIIGVDFYLTLDGPNRWALPIIVTPYVTPEMFGAYGDGTEDDTDAIRHAAKYKHVIMNKSYVMSGSVPMISGQTIEGRGTVKDICSEGATPYEYPACFEMTSTDGTVIKGLSFIGQGVIDGAIYNHAVIKVDQATNALVEDLTMRDINAGSCVRVTQANGVTVRGLDIRHYSFCGISVINGSENCTVENNRLEEVENYTLANTYPIGLSGYDGSMTPAISKHIVCRQNYVKNSRAWWEGIDSHGGEDIQIIDNTIIGCMCSINAGVILSPSLPMTNLIIKGNVCENGSNTAHVRTPAVMNSCIAAGGENVVVSDNILINGGCINASQGNQSAIYFTNSKNAVITGNVFRNTNIALLDIREADGLDVSNNVSYGLHISTPSADSYGKCSGFRMAYGAFTWKDVHIHHNTFTDTDLGTTANMLLAVGYQTLNTASYIKVDNNVVDVEWIWYYGNKMVSSPCIATDIASRVFGHIGDVCFNHAPASGQPKGWICTATWVNGSGGAWTSLGNL